MADIFQGRKDFSEKGKKKVRKKFNPRTHSYTEPCDYPLQGGADDRSAVLAGVEQIASFFLFLNKKKLRGKKVVARKRGRVSI